MDYPKKNSIKNTDSADGGNSCSDRFRSILAIEDLLQFRSPPTFQKDTQGYGVALATRSNPIRIRRIPISLDRV
ncbi:hypothetical protein TNCV_2364301 [Trichonephila clavipes]|nr:hypothetical protein TNCV_2364301 [Trichonephila clavipes]